MRRTEGSKTRGFTIVELLIVIVVIAILVAVVVVTYNGINTRAANAKRDSDVAVYYKAILAARLTTGQPLRYITNYSWSMGYCSASSGNPGNVEPKDLPKSHACWTQYYDNLSRIGAAADMNLSGLRAGDARGNPYTLDENEGESCASDRMYSYTGNGAASTVIKTIPRISEC